MSHFSKTSPEHYLTGRTALNIPCPEGTGDWHFNEVFVGYGHVRPVYLVAGIDLVDSTSAIGQMGVYDCRQRLEKMGLTLPAGAIYAADHYRAILDIVNHAVLNGLSFERSIWLDDWLPEAQEKQKLFTMLQALEPKLSAQQWSKIQK